MLARSLAAALVVAMAAALTSCAVPHSLSDPVPGGVPTPRSTESFGTETKEVEGLVLRYGDSELHVAAGIYPVMDRDEVPAERPTIVADELYVFVSHDGWNLSVNQWPTGDASEAGIRTIFPEQRELGGGWWVITPGGPAGEYVLDIHAESGPGLPIGGKVGMAQAYVTLVTTEARAIEAGGLLTVDAFAGQPGWVYLGIADLAETPAEASATVRLTTADGASLEVVLTNTSEPAFAGELMFNADIDVDDSSALADGFEYEIEMVLDGTTYRASGSGEAKAEVTPVFDPALKGFGEAD